MPPPGREQGGKAGSEGARQGARGARRHVILGFRVPTTCYDIIWGKGARGQEAGSEGRGRE